MRLNKVGKRLSRLIQSSQIGVCCRNNPPRPRRTRLLCNPLAHPRCGLSEALGMKVGDTDSDGGIEVVWVEWADADRALEMLDGKIRVVEKISDPAAVMP